MTKRSKISIALSIAAIFGVGVTAALAAKGAKKKEPTIKNYIPAIVSGTVTAGCIVGSQVLSFKEIAAITAAGSAIAVKYEDLKNYISKEYPDEYKAIMSHVDNKAAVRAIERNPHKEESYDGRQRYYFPLSDQIVYMKPEDWLKVQWYFSSVISTEMEVHLNDILDYIHHDLGYKDVHICSKDYAWGLDEYPDDIDDAYDVRNYSDRFPRIDTDEFDDILDDDGETVVCRIVKATVDPHYIW